MTDNVFAPPRSDVELKEGPEALWDLDWKEIRKLYLASVNVRAIGALYGLGAFGLLMMGGVFMMSPSEQQGVGLELSAITLLIGLFYVVGCVTSFTRPAWARWFGIVMSVFTLLGFPVGTLIGILMLIAYIQGGKLFGPDRFLHKDVVLVYKQRKAEKR